MHFFEVMLLKRSFVAISAASKRIFFSSDDTKRRCSDVCYTLMHLHCKSPLLPEELHSRCTHQQAAAVQKGCVTFKTYFALRQKIKIWECLKAKGEQPVILKTEFSVRNGKIVSVFGANCSYSRIFFGGSKRCLFIYETRFAKIERSQLLLIFKNLEKFRSWIRSLEQRRYTRRIDFRSVNWT